MPHENLLIHFYFLFIGLSSFLPYLKNTYSTVSIESTILIFEIFRSGIAVAIKQAPTAKRVASRMGMTGIATSWRVSLVAASMKIVQTYPSTLPITEAIIP